MITNNRRWNCLFSAMAVVALLVSCSSDSEEDELPPVELTPDAHAAAETGNRFALDLYQQLRGREGNLFFSPSSLSIALAMTYGGAAGTTKAEMAKTLHFTMPDESLHDGMQVFQAYLKAKGSGKRVRLKVANRLWGQQGYQFRPEFLALTRNQYDAELASLDFASNPDQAARKINRWVAEHTENKITDVISSDQLSAETVLVLTNAVYFNSNWAKKFEANNTKDADFHISADETVQVPLMFQKEKLRFAAIEELKLVQLAYLDESLSMIAILPDAIDGLPAVEARLTADNLKKWTDALSQEEVKVFIPKFKTTSQFDLSNTLQAMGMKAAFEPGTADFSKMSDKQGGVFIDRVIHKAYVDVNEDGTEAAAVTYVSKAKSERPTGEPPVFRADHPFIFLIRDNESNAILFLGRLVDPRA
ncbi:MAG: serpin family protein [Planctomycetaceae bacterium]